MATGKKLKTYKLEESAFFRLRSLNRLLALLHLTKGQLALLTESDPSLLYTEWDELSKSGKSRHIENPNPHLKRVQRRILVSWPVLLSV